MGNYIASQNQIDNLVAILDGYFSNSGENTGNQHLNVNIIHPDLLKDAQEHPEKYASLSLRVSGYCVYFNELTKEQQDEIISRTFHEYI